MAKRKTYLMRIHPDILEAMQSWADDELRSLNAQIEFVMRKALKDVGRIKIDKPDTLVISDDLEGDNHPQDKTKPS